jgi:hypothetical protein
MQSRRNFIKSSRLAIAGLSLSNLSFTKTVLNIYEIT